MELDTRRKLIIGALDPRHDTTAGPNGPCPHDDGLSVRDVDCKSGFYVISYADPGNMRQIGDFVSLPSGHTSSCIQNCKYIWTGGPARRSDQDWLTTIILKTSPATEEPTLNNRLIGDGRPIWVTDLRDPARPRVSDLPVDLYRNDGYTDYSHDVDEDARGIAWVAGRGGIRGYATEGRHRDPYQNRYARGVAFRPGPRRRRRHRVGRTAVPRERRQRRRGAGHRLHAQLRAADGWRRPGIGREERQRPHRDRGGLHAALLTRAAESLRSTSRTPGAASQRRTRPGRTRTG